MRKRNILGIVVSVAVLAAGLESKAFADQVDPSARLLFHCLLDKSNSLNVYRGLPESGGDIFFEVDNFMFGKELVLTVQRPNVVEYGNVFIALKDEGRSGYFLMRFEKGRKPANEDIGDSTISMDNNLFQAREKRFFTGGEQILFHDCTSAKDPN